MQHEMFSALISTEEHGKLYRKALEHAEQMALADCEPDLDLILGFLEAVCGRTGYQQTRIRHILRAIAKTALKAYQDSKQTNKQEIP